VCGDVDDFLVANFPDNVTREEKNFENRSVFGEVMTSKNLMGNRPLLYIFFSDRLTV